MFCSQGNSRQSHRKKQLTPEITARWLSLKKNQLSAVYWLQSAQLTTDNFLSRIGSDLTNKNHNWVLVSILFDSSLQAENQEVKEFAGNVYDTVKQSLQGEINEN